MRATDRLWNVLTALLLGLTAVSCLCVGAVFANPAGLFNALAPATMPVLLSAPTAAQFTTPVTFPTLPPEWTATASPPPSVTPTRRVTATKAEPENTQSLAPGATVTPFPTPIGPTITPTETELPTRTPTNTRPVPTRTPTQRSYPAAPTRVPVTNTPAGYP
jgi:hypothetical protein